MFTVIKDSREKAGYDFPEDDYCTGTVVHKLDTGDYSIVGLEDKVCIERKAATEELGGNLGSGRKTFMKEIERMKQYPHKFLLFEFSLDELLAYPHGTKIPKRRIKYMKMTGKFMLSTLMDFQINDDIQVVFCGNREATYRYAQGILRKIDLMYRGKNG